MALHALPTQSVLSASRADAPRFDACATPASLAQVLDRYFGNVCELDLIFNFHKAYYILDEIFVGGELCESSKKEVLSVCAQMDELMEEREEDKAASGSSGRVRK